MVVVHHRGRKSGRECGNPMMYLPHDTEPDIIYVTFRDRTLYPRARWALFRGTKRSSHARRSTSHVFAGGAPGARTLNPRIKRGLPGRAGRSTCADATRQCPESTHRAGIRSALVPRVVPRYPGRVPGGSVTVSDGYCPGSARGAAVLCAATGRAAAGPGDAGLDVRITELAAPRAKWMAPGPGSA
jgi:hypothetical protein